MGPKQAAPILIKGLHRLEYRGYDSAGIALINAEGTLSVYKSKGKVSDLEKLINDKDTSGTIGIAHTRWATHGEPNDINAHPHYSEHKNLALIHNGIIENYKALKKELLNKGYHFHSECRGCIRYSGDRQGQSQYHDCRPQGQSAGGRNRQGRVPHRF